MIKQFSNSTFNPRVTKIKTATYTVLIGDDEVQVTPSAASTMTLPALSDLLGAGLASKAIRIKKMDTGAAVVIITASGNDTIGGSDQDLVLGNYLDDVILQSSVITGDWIIAYANLDVDGEKFASLYTGISTSNTVSVLTRHSGASGAVRGLFSSIEYTGTNVGVSQASEAIRGLMTISGTIAGSNTAYMSALQGRFTISGTMTGGKVSAIRATIQSCSGTLSGGTLYGIYIDGMGFNKAVGGGQGVVGIGIELPDGAIRFDSFLWMYGRATCILQAENLGLAASTAATSPSGAGGWLKVIIDGNTRYINLYTTP
jgi:hypothetical protein